MRARFIPVRGVENPIPPRVVADGAVESIRARLRQGPAFFLEIVEAPPDVDYREVLEAWGGIRQSDGLERDPEGRYLLR